MYDLPRELIRMGEAARQAARRLARAQTAHKNRCLEALADILLAAGEDIVQASDADLENARRGSLFHETDGVQKLTPEAIEKIARNVRNLAGQPDPVGRVDSTWIRPNGLRIEKTRVPIGVVGIPYQGLPYVTIAAATLCLKSGNAAFLCSDDRWRKTNFVLEKALAQSLSECDLPSEAVQVFIPRDPEALAQFLALENYIDLLIPKGDKKFADRVVQLARIPVLRSNVGVCHIYVDQDVNRETAIKIIDNACRDGSRATTVDVILVHEKIAGDFLVDLDAWRQNAAVDMLGDKRARHLLPTLHSAHAAWNVKRPPSTVAVKIVDSLTDAVEHIAENGAEHSEAIVTESKQAAKRFCDSVDAAAVYVNASTRFTDAQEFGMGPQIVVGTSHFHARGPVGLEELTLYKYVVTGNGQVR